MKGHKQKALLAGNYSRVEYHPLDGVDGELCAILRDEWTVECTEDFDTFRSGKLDRFRLCISYIDTWKEKKTREQVAGLLSFVCGGGGLLVVHNGISLHNDFELAQMMGAKFLGHPAQATLRFKPAALQHEIMNGIGAFEIDDEPYRFEFSNLMEKTILFEYENEGSVWPAAWAHVFGLGRVVYLMPGHTAGSFANPVYREIIRRSARWVTGNG